MSIFKKLFKKKDSSVKLSSKTEKATSKAVTQMQDTEDLLTKRRDLLQRKMEKEQEMAKASLAKGDRKAAAAALKRKKQYEAQMVKLDTQIDNIAQMNGSVQDATIGVDVLNSQVQGTKALKGIYKQVGGIDKVDKVYDDVRDAMDASHDLSQALSQNIGGGEMIDESELEDELAALEQETELKQKPIKIVRSLPSPGSAYVNSTRDEEDLAALEASMV
ncbi:charged multivesicular body protein VPS20 [Acrasis kona]|uniref:Charged multivesicular body protein VPS20 n=1 Tax=Acrasis kona TaxID=1008807 RepID=A0AAW2ZGJ7_9EUKA